MTARTPGTPLPPPNFAALAAELLARAEQLLGQWLPGIKFEGGEYKCGGLGGKPGRSLCINLAKGGVWSDFATGETGRDLLDLYCAQRGIGKTAGAVELANDLALWDVAGTVRPKDVAHGAAPVASPVVVPVPLPVAAPAPERDAWEVVAPVPEWAPAATFRHHHRADADVAHIADYLCDGERYGYVVRFETSDGGKDTLPYTFCTSQRDGASRWHWKTWPEPRPLYYPGGTSPGMRTVVLVEGERKAQVLQALLDGGAPGVYCVASWAGGCKAWAKAQWSWLAGTTVLLWPDCDAHREVLPLAVRKALADDPAALDMAKGTAPLLSAPKQPGMAAMLGIGRLLEGLACTVSLLPIPAPLVVPAGWDCADAIEVDGWGFERVQALFAAAGPLPVADAADVAASDAATGARLAGLVVAGAAGAGGKKIEGPVGTESNGDGGDGAGGGKPWWLKPYWDDGKSRWLVSRKMVIACLRNDPLLCDVLAFDELNNEPRARLDWPFLGGKAGSLSDATDLRIGDWLSTTYGVSSIPRAALIEAMQTVADERRYHPIREWLAGLVWDGKPRIDKWLLHALGQRPGDLPSSQVEYLRLVGRYWLIGMVARVQRPGCKFDYMVVLEGSGGLRKSTLPKVLAGEDWFSDSMLQIERGKESYEQVQGRWCYEVPELASMSRVDVNLIKAFIASTDDRYRGAYGRVVQSHPRQVVFVGTTNERAYLRDRTGNRRFWPVAVTQPINTEWVARYREQLFAEALALYTAGEVYAPTPEQEQALFEPRQREREVQTAIDSELRRLLTREGAPAGAADTTLTVHTKFVTLAQVVKALGVDVGKATAGQQSEVRGWFASEGWPYTKKQIDGVRAHGWERPIGWPKADAPQAAEAMPPRGADGQANGQMEGDDDVPF